MYVNNVEKHVSLLQLVPKYMYCTANNKHKCQHYVRVPAVLKRWALIGVHYYSPSKGIVSGLCV